MTYIYSGFAVFLFWICVWFWERLWEMGSASTYLSPKLRNNPLKSETTLWNPKQPSEIRNKPLKSECPTFRSGKPKKTNTGEFWVLSDIIVASLSVSYKKFALRASFSSSSFFRRVFGAMIYMSSSQIAWPQSFLSHSTWVPAKSHDPKAFWAILHEFQPNRMIPRLLGRRAVLLSI